MGGDYQSLILRVIKYDFFKKRKKERDTEMDRKKVNNKTAIWKIKVHPIATKVQIMKNTLICSEMTSKITMEFLLVD